MIHSFPVPKQILTLSSSWWWVANARTYCESVKSIHFYSAVVILKTFKLVIHIKQTFNVWPHYSHTWNHITT